MRSRIHLSEHFTYGKLLRFTLPSVVMNVFASLYIVADGYFVANYAGKTEFAAVNLIMPVLNILGETGYMFGVGGSALIAKTLGEKNREQANRLFSLIVLVTSCLGVLMMVAGFIFMPQITAMLGAKGSLLEYSALYGRIFILALPAWIWVYEFQLFFVTAEKPGLGLAVTICAGLCNVALDALFIICFKWGIVGAAAASALSQIVGGVLPIIYFVRRNNSLLKLVKPVWDGRALIHCCINGSSEFMAEAASSLVGIIYNTQLLKYAGEDGVVIYGLLMYVSLIFTAIFVGYSNGIGPVFSYHYGAQDQSELKNLLKRSLIIIGVTSVMMFVISESMAHPFSALFLEDALKLLPDAVHAFRIASVAYLFTGMAVFGSAFFTALNNGPISALISFLRTFVFELGAVLMLPVLLGVEGIWYSVVFAELMAAVTGSIFMVAFRKKYLI
ncbi:MAG: MATE family efflux transporter [Lachnospiraceae bacterium]|nr:MATE family efflux transporter [Lachnospiraceae bacterium]MBR4183941.1 MATE family efflux transporter [Lachnospiraceae bacterium]